MSDPLQHIHPDAQPLGACALSTSSAFAPADETSRPQLVRQRSADAFLPLIQVRPLRTRLPTNTS